MGRPKLFGSGFALICLAHIVAVTATTQVTVGQQATATMGQQANLFCNYTTSGTGRITVTWSRDPAGSNTVIVDHEVGADTFYYGDQVGRISLVDSASLQINMTELTDSGVYRCTVDVRGTGQDSGDVTLQVIEPTTVPPPTVTTQRPVTTPTSDSCEILPWLVIVFSSQALWAAILMIAILVADALICGTCCCCTPKWCCCCWTSTCNAVQVLACAGPLVGLTLAGIVIALVCVLTNSESRQWQFWLIVGITIAAALLSIGASIGGCLFKKHGNRVNFPVVTMLLEFILGMMVAIAGMVISADCLKGNEEYQAGVALGGICIVLLLAAFIWFVWRVCFAGPPVGLELHPLSHRKVDVQWTAQSNGSYRVLYRLAYNSFWTSGPEVSTEDYPNYKYTVDFPQDGRFQVLAVKSLCLCCCCDVSVCCIAWFGIKTEIKEIRVNDSAVPGNPCERNMPVYNLHGNNAPKSDVPVVVKIREGQSQQVELDTIIIDKQKPAEKKKKKKKKGKKVNKVNASDEDIKPEN